MAPKRPATDGGPEELPFDLAPAVSAGPSASEEVAGIAPDHGDDDHDDGVVDETGDASPPVADVPELVPARMVNEFVYCPRLFHLEWVQAQFETNADVEEGKYLHRVVDQPTGRAPAPEAVDQLRVARSVRLSSPSLGLVGVIDLLEGAGDEVVPVDFKKGGPPEGSERIWAADEAQIVAQVLLLRDNGYSCSRAVISYAETRRREVLEITPAHETWVLSMLERLRVVAASGEPPPPLMDSPKCPRCSLVGICLPDEHNLLTKRSKMAPRRLLPSDPASRPLYVLQAGSTVGVRSGRFVVTTKGRESTAVRILDVSQLCVYGNVQVTTQALLECFARDLTVVFLSGGGWVRGVAQGLPSKHVELRRRQVALVGHGGLDAARRMVVGKIKNARVLLRRNGRPAPDDVVKALAGLATQAAEAGNAASLLGYEGTAARLYFQSFPSMLKAPEALPGGVFDFSGRNRRPPKDAVNCLLSYVYALLVKDLVGVCIAIGLDPYLGVYHRPRFGRPALALDLAEEFRPLLADSAVVGMINNGEVRPADFVVRAGGVGLTDRGRRMVIAAYERRLDIQIVHPVFRYRLTYRRVLEVQARVLGAWMLGEIPAYEAFTTR